MASRGHRKPWAHVEEGVSSQGGEVLKTAVAGYAPQSPASGCLKLRDLQQLFLMIEMKASTLVIMFSSMVHWDVTDCEAGLGNRVHR